MSAWLTVQQTGSTRVLRLACLLVLLPVCLANTPSQEHLESRVAALEARLNGQFRTVAILNNHLYNLCTMLRHYVGLQLLTIIKI